jgi:hypothetical protein
MPKRGVIVGRLSDNFKRMITLLGIKLVSKFPIEIMDVEDQNLMIKIVDKIIRMAKDHDASVIIGVVPPIFFDELTDRLIEEKIEYCKEYDQYLMWCNEGGRVRYVISP